MVFISALTPLFLRFYSLPQRRQSKQWPRGLKRIERIDRIFARFFAYFPVSVSGNAGLDSLPKYSCRDFEHVEFCINSLQLRAFTRLSCPNRLSRPIIPHPEGNRFSVNPEAFPDMGKLPKFS
jgi:hypothetical protein